MNSDTDPGSSPTLDPLPSGQAGEGASKKSRIITTVLSPAVKLWLRSQLEQVENLQLTIEAGDRQILSGEIGRISVSAQKAVYRGLHLSQVSINGAKIRTNLGQVLRGKALRLLEAFPVEGEVQLTAADLNQSLKAPLLANAVIDFLLLLLKSEGSEPVAETIQLQDPQAMLGDGQITFTATLVSDSGNLTPVVIRTGLSLASGNQLRLDRPQWLPHANARQGMVLKELDGMTFNLGSDVVLQELRLTTAEIRCQGQILVRPEVSS